MWPDDSAARNAMAPATASTGTQVFGSTPGMAARLAGVSIVLGSTAFTVTPRRASRRPAPARRRSRRLGHRVGDEAARGGMTARGGHGHERPERP